MLSPQASLPREPLPGIFRSCSWWSQSLRDAVADRWEALGASSCRPLVVHSGCGGLLTEILTCKALGIPLAIDCIASEIKEACREFMRRNIPEAKHIVDSLASYTAMSSFCDRCGGLCEMSQSPDVLVLGPPCQPYTTANPDRPVHLHKLYHTLFGTSEAGTVDEGGSVIEAIRAKLPGCLIVEQVEGFALDSEIGVPLEKLLGLVLGITHGGLTGFYTAAKIFQMNPSLFVKVNRPRLSSTLHLCTYNLDPHQPKVCNRHEGSSSRLLLRHVPLREGPGSARNPIRNLRFSARIAPSGFDRCPLQRNPVGRVFLMFSGSCLGLVPFCTHTHTPGLREAALGVQHLFPRVCIQPSAVSAGYQPGLFWLPLRFCLISLRFQPLVGGQSAVETTGKPSRPIFTFTSNC
jgi:hypothetical protein